MYCLFCVVLCIVCVYMCTVLLPLGGYPIAVKYIISGVMLVIIFADNKCLGLNDTGQKRLREIHQ
jgi:ABC-type sulfate transport system permease subunit